ncbi:MAG: heavy-metal-associated domain-containing protein [Treponema sp.]|nr:heavy-metal-associated domain-containing protein [Treponema sp.]
MERFIIISALLASCTGILWSLVHKIRHGSSCCGRHEVLQKKIHVRDRHDSHYPFAYSIAVDGMHCSNCVRHVENALHALPDVWATASLEKKQVLVRTKVQAQEDVLKKAIFGAGYTPLSFTCVRSGHECR